MATPDDIPQASIRLRNGSEMPMVGFGTYLCTEEEAEEAVLQAIHVGYRHIDTAEFYANHTGIRKAIEASGLERSELFITDKLMPGIPNTDKQKTYEETVETLKKHLELLGTTYIDLYLLHHAFAKQQRLNHYRALLDMQKEGLIREVGVSNYNIHHIQEIKDADLPLPAANQIEIHSLCCQRPLVAYLKQNGIVPIAYSSLAPLSTWRADPSHTSGKRCEEWEHLQIIQSVARKHSVTDAQVLLKWALQHGYPILPKSTKLQRIASNFDMWKFEISEEDMQALDALDKNQPLAWGIGNPLLCE